MMKVTNNLKLIKKKEKKMDNKMIKMERKQWRENSLLQSRSIQRLSEELDMLRKQKEMLQEKLLKVVTNDG